MDGPRSRLLILQPVTAKEELGGMGVKDIKI